MNYNKLQTTLSNFNNIIVIHNIYKINTWNKKGFALILTRKNYFINFRLTQNL